MMRKKTLKIVSSLDKLCFLLFAILPATESKDWLFFTCAALMLGLLAVYFVGVYLRYRNDERGILRAFRESKRDYLHEVFISLIGVIVALSQDSRLLYFWLFMLVVSCVGFLWPRQNAEKE